MTRSGRRILLMVEPAVLEGALATMLAAGEATDIVHRGRPDESGAGRYDAAVVSDELPPGVEAGVVITLPDTRGSAGVGTVSRGDVVDDVAIDGAEQVMALLHRYAPATGD